MMRDTRISLSVDSREAAILSLRKNLANTLFANLSSKYSQWNVKGARCYSAIKLFSKICKFYEMSANKLGERIVTLGGEANSLPTDIISDSDLGYSLSAFDSVYTHMKAMADLLGQVTNGYRQGIEEVRVPEVNDQVTQQIFINLGMQADKLLYLLENSLN